MKNIREILSNSANRRPLYSRIAPIATMGRPVKSKYTQLAESISDPTEDWGYVQGGDIAAGLASGLKSYLGFRGAMQDAQNERAYNDYLAQLAERDRADKMDQQQWERNYKENALAQDLEKAQMAIDANKEAARLARQQALADRKEQYAHEQAVYDRNREAALADLKAQNEAKQQAAYLSDMNAQAAKTLNPEDYAKWRQNPQAFDISGGGWWARKFGKRADLQPKQGNSFANLSDEDLLKGL